MKLKRIGQYRGYNVRMSSVNGVRTLWMQWPRWNTYQTGVKVPSNLMEQDILRNRSIVKGLDRWIMEPKHGID